jgi:hypothetical protein
VAPVRIARAVAACLLSATVIAAEPRAKPPRPTEYQVKAAYLYNFAKFVEWPAVSGREDRFVIAVLGEDPFGEVLDRALNEKTIESRPIVVRRLRSIDESVAVDVLFISDSERPRLAQVLRRTHGNAILTVSEADDFVGLGGMVGFKMQDDVVRFDVNLDQVSAAGLKMSSQLIRVARRVVSASGSS